MTRWLLVRGLADRPLNARVDASLIRTQSSTKRPSVQVGDEAILYASVWQCVYGVVEITGAPENDASRTRWQWAYSIRPLAVVDDLHHAPACEEAGIFPQSLWRHSHIRLSDVQFERARELIEAAVADRLTSGVGRAT